MRRLFLSTIVLSTFLVAGAGCGDLGDGSGGRYEAVSAGQGHTCARDRDGSVRCWGDDSHGQTDEPFADFRSISAGDDHTCGVLASGAVDCWGLGSDANFDEDGEENGDFDQAFPPNDQFSVVESAADFTCGLTSGGSVDCWGSRRGAGGEVTRGRRFRTLSCAEEFCCGIESDGTLGCWGDVFADQYERREVTDIGAGEVLCFVEAGGAVICDGVGRPELTDPPAGTFTEVTVGQDFACALRESKQVSCWGSNEYDQLEAPDERFEQIDAGELHACGVTADNRVECWGYNRDGQANAF